MTPVEQVESLKLPVGADFGQVILFVDLTEVVQPSAVLRQLSEAGYAVQIRYLELKVGLHVVAVLYDETEVTEARYEQLLEEWETLALQITPDDPNKAVRLWRGRSLRVAA